MPDETTEVTDNPERSRFELHLEDGLAGWVDYRRSDDRLVLTHTEVDPAYQGQRLGGRLARAALDSAWTHGTPVVPQCPYLAEYIRRHPDYLPVVHEEHRAELDAAEG